MDELEIPEVKKQVAGKDRLTVINKTKNLTYIVKLEVSDRERKMLLLGGKINRIKELAKR